jgi:Glycosyltransferase family 87
MRSYAIFYAIAGLTAGLSIILSRLCLKKYPLLLSAGMVASGIGWWMWTVSDPPIAFLDFEQAYYPAGRAIIADIPALYHRIAACEETAICGFVNIPIVAFLFAPLSVFTLSTAQLLFAVLSLMCVLLTIYMMWSVADAPVSRKHVIAFLFVLNGPLFYSLKEGNVTHFALLLLAAAVVCLDKERDCWAGALLAVAAVLKLPLLLLGLYFAIKRRWYVVTGFGFALAVLSSVSLIYAGWNAHVEWYQEAIQPFADKGLSAFNVQSVDGFLLRLGDDARLYDWKPADVTWKVRALRYLVATVLLGMSWRLFVRDPGANPKETQLLELSMVLCVALIISPISWTHYYLLLLLPLSLYAGRRLTVPQHGASLGGMVLCVLLIAPPVTFVQPTSWILDQIMTKLIVSHYLAGAIILCVLLGYARLQMSRVEDHRTIQSSRLIEGGAHDRGAFLPISR